MATNAERVAQLRKIATFRIKVCLAQDIDLATDPLLDAVYAGMAALLDAEGARLPATATALDERIGQAKALAAQLEQALDSHWQSVQLGDETRERSRLALAARADAVLARLEAELGELGELATKAGWDPEAHGRLVDWLAGRLGLREGA